MSTRTFVTSSKSNELHPHSLGAVVLILGIGALLVACSSPSHYVETLQPIETKIALQSLLPTPEFIVHTDPESGYVGPFVKPTCFSIWDGPPLVAHVDSGSYIFDNTTFIFDGDKVDAAPVSQIDLLLLVRGYDKNGKLIERSGPLETCFDLSLQPGLHTAQLIIKSMSGMIYTYAWAFHIQNAEIPLSNTNPIQVTNQP